MFLQWLSSGYPVRHAASRIDPVCNRYVSPDDAAIERFWQVRPGAPWHCASVYPRAPGPFIHRAPATPEPAKRLAIGQSGLIPWFAKEARLPHSTNNACAGEITTKASYKQPWNRGQRCIIPAMSIDEPCWETGKNVWWRSTRSDGASWGLAGLWNT
jgi:putative SOS response-associated peptidase YedK